MPGTPSSPAATPPERGSVISPPRLTRPAALAASIAVAVAAVLAVGACGSGGPAKPAATPATSSAMAGPAAAPGPNVTTGATAAGARPPAAPESGASFDAQAFAAAMAIPGTVVLDVRTPAEFASGHLAGAVNIDIEAADFDARIGSMAKAVPYAVYCRSGNRSGVALARMSQLGFTHAYHLAGGIGAWQKAGLPINR